MLDSSSCSFTSIFFLIKQEIYYYESQGGHEVFSCLINITHKLQKLALEVCKCMVIYAIQICPLIVSKEKLTTGIAWWQNLTLVRLSKTRIIGISWTYIVTGFFMQRMWHLEKGLFLIVSFSQNLFSKIFLHPSMIFSDSQISCQESPILNLLHQCYIILFMIKRLFFLTCHSAIS